MTSRKRKAALPTAGAAFAFPLDDGRLSVCRVLLDGSSGRASEWRSKDIALVCGSTWIGDRVPAPDDPALRPILHLTHHLWADSPELLWVSDPPPSSFVPIGSIEPTLREQALPCSSFGYWDSFPVQVLAQWRWDHDRAAVTSEDASKREEEELRSAETQRARREYLATVTLEQLRERPFFSGWRPYQSARRVNASRQIMQDTVAALIALGPGAPRENRLAALERCVEAFNALDARSRFIETIEREEICEELEAIAHACGVGYVDNLADRWRDW
jgi:hypothetical protein